MLKEQISSGKEYSDRMAYLEDRILIAENKPQKFATQVKGFDASSNLPIFFDIEDSLNVDKKRKSVDLMPLNYYKKLLLNQYRKNSK